jgi:hypothetical protein
LSPSNFYQNNFKPLNREPDWLRGMKHIFTRDGRQGEKQDA